MRKLMLSLFVLSLVCFFGCGKNVPSTPSCTDVFPYDDSTALLAFAGDSIHAKFDSSGIFYEILDSGTDSRPNAYSYLKVNYIGKLMTNKIFDSATNSTLGGNPLGRLIPAWGFGLSKIGVGGRIRILSPSAYAYGCNGTTNGVIPPNSPLYFDITLLSIY